MYEIVWSLYNLGIFKKGQSLTINTDEVIFQVEDPKNLQEIYLKIQSIIQSGKTYQKS